MSQKSPFVVIEALDAGGSQTQTNLLAARLRKDGYSVLQLHFPHEDRATGRLLYDKFLLNKNEKKFSRREQALLYIQDFYSRLEDIRRTQAALGRNVVLSDRFYGSTFAYQMLGLTGKQRAAMQAWLWWLVDEDTPALPRPNLVLFLDTPVNVSLDRLKGKKRDWFETRAKLTAIRSSYLKVAREQKWVTIPSVTKQETVRSREELHGEVWKAVAPLLQ